MAETITSFIKARDKGVGVGEGVVKGSEVVKGSAGDKGSMGSILSNKGNAQTDTREHVA